jgi:hypothetical protein
MFSLFSIILTGFLVRADGWGTDEPRWQRLAKFFNAFSCAGLFALLCALSSPLLPSLAAGLAFLVWRLPGFRMGGLPKIITKFIHPTRWLAAENGWQNWRNMFVRGLWTSAVGFTLISLVAHGHIWGVLLAAPFSAAYMLIYSGGYKWLPETIFGFNRHVWIELASGSAFGAFILAVIYG